jgi:hypothetical protein
MDEQKPEEAEGRLTEADAPQLPQEVKYETSETPQSPEEIKYQSLDTSQPPEEVRPQVIGTNQPLEERAHGMAIAAMVVGIAGILCSWVIVFSFPLGVAALVLGIIEFKRIKDGASSEKGRGMAITGIILGSLTIFGVIIYIIVIALTAVGFITGMTAFLPKLMEQFGTFY